MFRVAWDEPEISQGAKLRRPIARFPTQVSSLGLADVLVAGFAEDVLTKVLEFEPGKFVQGHPLANRVFDQFDRCFRVGRGDFPGY